MKQTLWILCAALGLSAHFASAQAPAGSTGQCKDGSYTSVASKSGACSGHKGVQTWFATASTPTSPAATAAKPAPAATATPKPAPAVTPAPAPAAASAPAPAPQPVQRAAPPATVASASSKTVAPGGGPGMVWVNTPTKVYHCPGTQYYGTTKDGKYMTESAALSMGAHADHGKACSK